MTQRSRKGLEIGNFQGTRQDILRGGPEKISNTELNFPRGRSDPEEKFKFLLEEVNNLWSSLRGGGSSKKTRFADMRLSQCMDQRGRIISLYTGSGFYGGAEIQEDIEALEQVERKIWVPASGVMWNTALTPPAAWNSTAGGARLGTLDLPQNTSTAMHTHYQAPMPRLWAGQSGTLTVTVPYAFNATNSDTFSLRTSIWSYDLGGGLTSPSATEWNETSEISMTLGTIEQWYEITQTNTVSFDADASWLSFRISRLGNNAADTFTGTVRILGALFELEV
jgi:hypothetical protein